MAKTMHSGKTSWIRDGTRWYSIDAVRDQLQSWVAQLAPALKLVEQLLVSEHSYIRDLAAKRLSELSGEMQTLQFCLGCDAIESWRLAQLRNEIPFYLKEAEDLQNDDEDLTVYRRIEVSVQQSIPAHTVNMDMQQVINYYSKLRDALPEEARDGSEEAAAYAMLLGALAGRRSPSRAVLSLYSACLKIIAQHRINQEQPLPETTLAICIDFIDQHDPYRREYPFERCSDRGSTTMGDKPLPIASPAAASLSHHPSPTQQESDGRRRSRYVQYSLF